MNINEIEAKSILRKHKRPDSWFVSSYGMNLYRGCTHNCVYCDGRAEGYYVEGEFGNDVSVKVNAIDILRRELDPKRKRTPFKKGFIMLGGGVGDSYQSAEEKYQLCRRALELIRDHPSQRFPVHVLTKSTLVKRDIQLLKEINRQSRAIVSFSFSSIHDKISARFEPGVPSPAERLEAIALLKSEGITCGMFLMPVIPFITDTPGAVEQAVVRAKEAGVDFIIFGGMTLKDGRQKEYFLDVLGKTAPQLLDKYRDMYRGSKWGEAAGDYYQRLNHMFFRIAGKYRIPVRIPPELFDDILDENDLVVVLLEHMDYFLKCRGEKSPYGYAAYSISQLKEPLSGIKGELLKLKGVGKATERIILEILETGHSSLYRTVALDLRP